MNGHPLNGAGALVVFVALALSAPANAKATYKKFDVQGSAGMGGVGINTTASIAGVWSDQNGSPHGFLRTPDGTITTFDGPNAKYTTPAAINDGGVIAGYFTDQSAVHGFLRAADGTISVYDAPNSGGDTSIYAINNKGAFAGYYEDADQLTTHAFVVSSTGKFRSFDPNGSQGTEATCINASGTVAGQFSDSKGSHGFIRTSDGTITTFDATPAGTGDSTSVNAIDGSGDVTGWFVDSKGVENAFLRTSDGTITSFQGVAGDNTIAYGIDKKGEIVGTYFDAGMPHGFYRTAAGAIKTITIRNTTGTGALAINDGGQITGYLDTDQLVVEGYLRTP